MAVGMLLPALPGAARRAHSHRGEASYVIDGKRQSYARFVVQEVEYEPLQPI